MNPEDIVFLTGSEAARLYQQLKIAHDSHMIRHLRFYAAGDGTIKWKVNEWCWEPAYGRRETERTENDY